MTYHPPDTLSWTAAWKNLRFLQLAVFVFAVMLVEALFSNSLVGTLAISFLYINALVVAISAADIQSFARRALIAFWLLTLTAKLTFPVSQSITSEILFRGIGAALIAVCIANIFRFAACSRRVTVDPLFAAIVVYLLIAMFFSQVYAIIYLLVPNSFSHPTALPGVNDKIPALTFNYFSLITISTVGYGDIVPRHPLTQILVTLEAVIGQFYVAIVVAWLVSLYASSTIASNLAKDAPAASADQTHLNKPTSMPIDSSEISSGPS